MVTKFEATQIKKFSNQIGEEAYVLNHLSDRLQSPNPQKLSAYELGLLHKITHNTPVLLNLYYRLQSFTD